MYERYTEDARRAVYFAYTEAVHRNESAISVRDVLLGLTWESHSRACAIGSLKENAVELRSLVGIPHLPSTAFPYWRKVKIPLDSNAKKVLAYAVREADHDKDFWIDSDHLLRGLLIFPNEAADALLKTGIELKPARTASVQHRKHFPSPPVPKGAKMKAAVRKYWFKGLMLAALLVIFIYLKLQG
jgi:hypothetical protein